MVDSEGVDKLQKDLDNLSSWSARWLATAVQPGEV